MLFWNVLPFTTRDTEAVIVLNVLLPLESRSTMVFTVAVESEVTGPVAE